jgi:hypothetical protein
MAAEAMGASQDSVEMIARQQSPARRSDLCSVAHRAVMIRLLLRLRASSKEESRALANGLGDVRGSVKAGVPLGMARSRALSVAVLANGVPAAGSVPRRTLSSADRDGLAEPPSHAPPLL